MIKPQTLKGFRDFLPETTIARQIVINKIKIIFERFGFDPIETPALEYAETLMGKYGSEADKLLYIFEDNGKRKVGLRYDQTVPLARVVAQYPELPKPFKRYQIQPVWRAENTQKGRFREFLQCDIDTVGTQSPLADVEIIACTLSVCKELGFKNVTMKINDRQIFDQIGLSKSAIITIDKLEKIGKDGVLNELRAKNIDEAEKLFTAIEVSPKTERLQKIFEALKLFGYKEGIDIMFDPFLARGLDYYTSTIFELKSKDYAAGSLAGGGRYDNLIGQFIGQSMPAVGIAFGFDRMIDAMAALRLLPEIKTSAQILVTIFSADKLGSALTLTSALRNKGINAEIYMDTDSKLEKQLKYADRKSIPFVVIQGPDEAARGVVKLKNMATKEQVELTIEQLIDKLKKPD